jgi:large subunit ribosomal protein L22
LRTSPTKIRPVLKLIAGKDVADARDTLRLCEREVARPVGKLLDSAVANAEHNDHVPEDELFVARAFADEGPIQKRWRPRARGRGVRINKRTSHITIVVARFEEQDLERRRRDGGIGPTRPRPARPTRRAPVEDHDHDHEHDHDHDHADEPAPAKKASPAESAAVPADEAGAGASRRRPKVTEKLAKKTAKKSTKKAEPAKKTAKKAAKKATKKAAPKKKKDDS